MGILFWPFRALWGMIGFVLGLVGRLTAAIIGFVFVIVGVILICTVIASIVGIPFVIFGFLLLARALF